MKRGRPSRVKNPKGLGLLGLRTLAVRGPRLATMEGTGVVSSLLNLTTSSNMAPPSKRTAEDLARVAEMMDHFVRDDNKALQEENEYRVQETDYYFGKMVDAYRRLEDMERRFRMAENTIARLRTERNNFAERTQFLENYLVNVLQADEDIDAVFHDALNPVGVEYDSDVTIMEDE